MFLKYPRGQSHFGVRLMGLFLAVGLNATVRRMLRVLIFAIVSSLAEVLDIPSIRPEGRTPMPTRMRSLIRELQSPLTS